MAASVQVYSDDQIGWVNLVTFQMEWANDHSTVKWFLNELFFFLLYGKWLFVSYIIIDISNNFIYFLQ